MAIQIEFKNSGKKVEWDDMYESILDIAEANDIKIETQCEAGVCGTCKTKMISGKVEMDVQEGLDEDDRSQNMILPCVAVPLTDLVLEI